MGDSMDVDDIISNLRVTSPSSNAKIGSELLEDASSLKRAWINERFAPELLAFEHDLLRRIMTRISQKVEYIAEESSEIPMSSDTKFQLLIVESELERIKFVVRGYLRARMIKIDKYMIFLEREPQEQVKLSDSELEYLQRHSEVLRRLYDQQFLGNLPQSLQRLDDMTGGLSMVETPDLNKAVVVRVNKSIETPAIVGTEEVFLQKDSLHLIHYRPVAHHIRDGTVQLV